jgi:hypothetical protein
MQDFVHDQGSFAEVSRIKTGRGSTFRLPAGQYIPEGLSAKTKDIGIMYIAMPRVVRFFRYKSFCGALLP